MTDNRRLWLAIVALIVGATLLSVSLPQMEPRGPITTNNRPEGLEAAWRYLAARDWDVQSWQRPLSELPPDGSGVLVLAIPATRPYRQQDLDAVRRWLMVGGDVLLLLDGSAPPRPGGWQILDTLGVEMRSTFAQDDDEDETATPGGPEAPDDARSAGTIPLPGTQTEIERAMRQEILLQPVSASADGPVRIRRVRLGVRPDPDETWMLRSADGRAGVRIRKHDRGRVAIVDDRSLLMNGWFARADAGNPAAVESILARLDADDGILYDEWHLGIEDMATSAPADSSGRRTLDLLLGHLLCLYAGIAWAIGRRFGPVRAPDPPPRTSVDRDLRALGALHTRAGHTEALGQRLLDLAHRRANVPIELPETFSGGPADLLALARKVAVLQAEGRI